MIEIFLPPIVTLGSGSAFYIALVVNLMLLTFLWQEGDVLFQQNARPHTAAAMQYALHGVQLPWPAGIPDLSPIEHVWDMMKSELIQGNQTSSHWRTYPPVLPQMVASLPLVQQVRGSIPGGVVNFHLKIFNLRARRSGDAHFLIARLCITGLD